eukprot:Tbor_TRINITY_DN5708_c1_g4::TRINITY_DN5708_c1_g4_i2::g.19968::m.19968
MRRVESLKKYHTTAKTYSIILPYRGSFQYNDIIQFVPVLREATRNVSFTNSLPPASCSHVNFDAGYIHSQGRKAVTMTPSSSLVHDLFSSDAVYAANDAGSCLNHNSSHVVAGAPSANSTRYQGLVSIDGGASTNIPTLSLLSSSGIAANRRRRGYGDGVNKEWGEGLLNETQNALREMMEFDLDDPFSPKQTADDEAFLESLELHAKTGGCGGLSSISLINKDKVPTGLFSSNTTIGDERDRNFEKEKAEERVLRHRSKLRPNPFADVKLFRNDNPAETTSGTLSVDVPARKIKEMFNDYENKKCRLCSEAYQGPWHIHSGFIPHSARESLAFEMLRPYCGTPDDVVKMWWWRLHYSKRFLRIRELSSDDPKVRRRRLFYLLKFLRDRQVIRDTFNVNITGGGVVHSGRSWEFERLEFLGDNVIKYLFNDRINVLFPVHEGGIRGKIAFAQFMIDGNDGLARAYDYVGMSKLTESDKVISKFKSDVVETVFGEMQLFMWSTEIDDGVSQHMVPFTPEMKPLRSLVAHTMEELGHVMIMYHIEYIAKVLNAMLQENNVKFLRADPTIRTNFELQQEIASSAYSLKQVSSQRRSPTSEKIPFPFHELAMMTEQYHTTMRSAVTLVGGLLPVGFARHELAPNIHFLDNHQHQLLERGTVFDKNVYNLLIGRKIFESPSLTISGHIKSGTTRQPTHKSTYTSSKNSATASGILTKCHNEASFSCPNSTGSVHVDVVDPLELSLV